MHHLITTQSSSATLSRVWKPPETKPFALVLKDNVPVNASLDFIKAQNLMEVEM
jgi:hypothetical protein